MHGVFDYVFSIRTVGKIFKYITRSVFGLDKCIDKSGFVNLAVQ
jgi:hypothetical protein